MLSNEQALAIIKQHDQCCVVWATDQNAIVAVHPIPKDAKQEELFAALGKMESDYSGPTKGRFLSSSTTSLQTLIDEARETDRVAGRVRVFNSWEHLRNDELLTILETAYFPEPMDAWHGSTHIVERLYMIRGPSLSRPQIDRLREFAFSPSPHPDQEKAQRTAQCYVAVLMNTPSDLVNFWHKHQDSSAISSYRSAFTSAAGDLAIDDHDIIGDLIEGVAGSVMFGMFGPRFEAMVALGKIGRHAGSQAAKVIRESIYDSSDEVVASRDRALMRIESCPDDWETCPDCYHGYVSRKGYDYSSIESWPCCLGFGHIPRRA